MNFKTDQYKLYKKDNKMQKMNRLKETATIENGLTYMQGQFQDRKR